MSVGIMASAVVTGVGGCTDVLAEPFNNLSAWTLTNTPVIAAGRNFTGVQMDSTFDHIDYTIPALSESNTLTFGVAWRATSFGLPSTEIANLRSDAGATSHHTLGITSTGNILVTGVAGSSTPHGMTAGGFYYIEWQIKLSTATDGFCIVKINGVTKINITGVATQGGGTKAVYDTLRLNGPASGVTSTWDDLYLSTGSACAFQGDHAIGATCIDVLAEPFDNLSAWAVTGAPTLITGRNGSGVQTFSSGSISLAYTIPLASESDTVTIGFAYKVASLALSVHPIILYGDAGATAQTTLRIRPDGSIAVMRGAQNGAELIGGVSAAGLVTVNTWNYYELQVKLDDTAGAAKVRLNGTVVVDVSGVDTRNAGTKVTYDQLRLSSQSTTATTHQWDDLYLSTGTACVFQGDHAVPSSTVCTDVLAEPFDNLSAWLVVGAVSNLSIVAGRNGTAAQIVGTTASLRYDLPAAQQADTITVGVAVKITSLAGQQQLFGVYSGTARHSLVLVSSSGAISVTDGNAVVTGSSATGVIVAGTWHYIEVSYFLHDTLGSIRLAVDGITRLSLFNKDTKSGASLVYDNVRLETPSGLSGGTVQYDDLYISTGSGCTFKGDHVVTNSTADVLFEPFNHFASWVVTSTPLVVAGRTGTAAEINSISDRLAYNIPAAFQSDTVTIGFAWRTPALQGDHTILALRSDAGATNHTDIRTDSAGRLLTSRAGAVMGTIAPAGTVAINTWYYLEWQVKLHDTTGFSIVRVNGVEVINSTGLDTKNAGTKTVYDQVLLPTPNPSSGGTNHYDDMYLSIGGAPFKGDITIP